MVQQHSRTGSAVIWGLAAGILAVVLIIIARLAFVTTPLLLRYEGMHLTSLYISVAPLLLLVVPLLFLGAAIIAAHRARALEAGLFAGLIAGGIVGAVSAISALAVPTAGFRGPLGGAVRPEVRVVGIELLRAISIGRGISIFVFVALVGAGIGALGGLIGRGSTTPPPNAWVPPQPHYPATAGRSGQAAAMAGPIIPSDRPVPPANLQPAPGGQNPQQSGAGSIDDEPTQPPHNQP